VGPRRAEQSFHIPKIRILKKGAHEGGALPNLKKRENPHTPKKTIEKTLGGNAQEKYRNP